jgi:hypothetical protein
MNLPLQMCAVSRGRFQKSRIVSSAGRVLPSWQFLCDQIACGCPDGSVACCDSEIDCSCGPNNGPAGCTGKGGGRTAGQHHDGGATGTCSDLGGLHGHFDCDKTGNIKCYDTKGGKPVLCYKK